MHNVEPEQLKTSDITSKIYTIAPTQLEYIAKLFGDTVADSMNMRAFAPKFRQIAAKALEHALKSAEHMGENRSDI